MSTLIFVVCAVLASAIPPELTADQLSMNRTAMGILDRIALAGGAGVVKPSIIVARSNAIAHWQEAGRRIVLDSGLFTIASRLGEKGEGMLAFIIGHEYAHYMRGHGRNEEFQHLFGSYVSVRGVVNQESKLLVAKLAEAEADYYGVYYALLAGYTFSAETFVLYWNEIGRYYGHSGDSSIYVHDEHQSIAERTQTAQRVIDEIQRKAYLHEVAYTALITGQYLQASVICEAICREINIPSVRWNELLARMLYLQELIQRRVVKPEVLTRSFARDFRYRSNSHLRAVDIAEVSFLCRSLIEVLYSMQFNGKALESMQGLLDLFGTVNECKTCSETSLCEEHDEVSKQLQTAIDSLLGGHEAKAGDYGPDVVPSDWIQISKTLDNHSRGVPYQEVTVSVGRARMMAFVEPDATYVRLFYSPTKLGVGTRIDLEIRGCGDCAPTQPVIVDNLVLWTTTGRVYRSAVLSE